MAARVEKQLKLNFRYFSEEVNNLKGSASFVSRERSVRGAGAATLRAPYSFRAELARPHTHTHTHAHARRVAACGMRVLLR